MLAEALPVTVEEEATSIPKWKIKAYKKKSIRERRRLEVTLRFGKSAFTLGKIPSGRAGVAFDRAVDRFMRDGSCRHGQALGNPCISFGVEAMCERDGLICDLETEKGLRYWREYE